MCLVVVGQGGEGRERGEGHTERTTRLPSDVQSRESARWGGVGGGTWFVRREVGVGQSPADPWVRVGPAQDQKGNKHNAQQQRRQSRDLSLSFSCWDRPPLEPPHCLSRQPLYCLWPTDKEAKH